MRFCADLGVGVVSALVKPGRLLATVEEARATYRAAMRAPATTLRVRSRAWVVEQIADALGYDAESTARLMRVQAAGGPLELHGLRVVEDPELTPELILVEGLDVLPPLPPEEEAQ